MGATGDELEAEDLGGETGVGRGPCESRLNFLA